MQIKLISLAHFLLFLYFKSLFLMDNITYELIKEKLSNYIELEAT